MKDHILVNNLKDNTIRIIKSSLVNNNVYHNTNEKIKLLIWDIPKEIKKIELEHLLSVFGELESLDMIVDPITKEFICKCLVEFKTEISSISALKCKYLSLK